MNLQIEQEEKIKQKNLKEIWDTQKDKSQRSNWDIENPQAIHNSKLPRNPLPVYTTYEIPHASNCQILNAEYAEDPRIIQQKKLDNRNNFYTNMLEKYNQKLSEAQTNATTAWAMQTMNESIKNLQLISDIERREKAKLIALDNQEMVQEKHEYQENLQRMEKLRNEQAKQSLQHDSMLLQDARTGYYVHTNSHGTRKAQDNYRGMLNSERIAIQHELQDTILQRAYDKDTLRKQKIAEDKALLTLENTVSTMALVEEMDAKNKKKLYYEELKQQAEIQAYQKQLQKEQDRKPIDATGAGILAGFGQSYR